MIGGVGALCLIGGVMSYRGRFVLSYWGGVMSGAFYLGAVFFSWGMTGIRTQSPAAWKWRSGETRKSSTCFEISFFFLFVLWLYREFQHCQAVKSLSPEGFTKTTLENAVDQQTSALIRAV